MCLFRLEKVDIRKINCQAKMLGTVVTVGGAMLMSLTKGPALNLPWARPGNHHSRLETIGNKQDFVMGSLMITAACFCWSCFMILQVSYQKLMSYKVVYIELSSLTLFS